MVHAASAFVEERQYRAMTTGRRRSARVLTGRRIGPLRLPFLLGAFGALSFNEAIAKPLECCQNPGRTYLFSVKESEKCGLPSARSYLFSKFATMLVMDEEFIDVEDRNFFTGNPSGRELVAGRTYEARVSACSTYCLEKEDESDNVQTENFVELWPDDSAQPRAPVEASDSCPEINLWARLVMFEQNPVATEDSKSKHGSHHAHKDEAFQQSTALLGDNRQHHHHHQHHRHRHQTLRALPNVVQTGCEWRFRFKVDQPGKHQLEILSASVHGSEEPVSTNATGSPSGGGRYVGLFQQKEGWNSDSSVCRLQGHVLGSPAKFKATALGTPQVLGRHAHAAVCNASTGNGVGGHWRRFAEKPCHTNEKHELKALVSKAKVLGEQTIYNVLWRKLHHAPSESIFFSSPSWTGWEAPRGWEDGSSKRSAEDSTLAPGWQLAPQCHLSKHLRPPGVIDAHHAIVKKIGVHTPPTYASGFEFVGANGCAFRHFSRGHMHQCLRERRIGRVIANGDSIMTAGFVSMFSYLLGVGSSGKALHTTEAEAIVISSGTRRCSLNHQAACLADITETMGVDAPPTLMVVNFAIHSLMPQASLAMVTNNAAAFFLGFMEAQRSGRIGYQHIFIFMSATAANGFREGHENLVRASTFSRAIAAAARPAGWLYVDAYNMTLSRPDASNDGSHFADPVNYMASQVLLGSVCPSYSGGVLADVHRGGATGAPVGGGVVL